MQVVLKKTPKNSRGQERKPKYKLHKLFETRVPKNQDSADIGLVLIG